MKYNLLSVLNTLGILISLTSLNVHAEHSLEENSRKEINLRHSILVEMEILKKKPELLERFPVQEVVKTIEFYSKRVEMNEDTKDSDAIRTRILALISEIKSPQVAAEAGIKVQASHLKLKEKNIDLKVVLATLKNIHDVENARLKGEKPKFSWQFSMKELESIGEELAKDQDYFRYITHPFNGNRTAAKLRSEIDELGFKIRSDEFNLKNNAPYMTYKAHLLSESFEILYDIKKADKK